ncbi:endonuclease domain-containing 1 protein-like [Rhinophrynus dorsalis]
MKMILSFCWIFLTTVQLTRALLSNNFNGCIDYFYKKQLPVGIQSIAKTHEFDPKNLPNGIKLEDLSSPAYLCQMHEGKSYFASLYDRGRRIPLYSAYILERGPADQPEIKRLGAFKIEPQLVYKQLGGNMVLEANAKVLVGRYNKDNGIEMKSEKNRVAYLLGKSQALDYDYNNKGYERGHLNPFGHHTQKAAGEATFTLTNVVPMKSNLNTLWSQYENSMVQDANQCTKMYVVTGIVPSNKGINNNRVTIPSHVWNAYCCVDNNDKPLKSGAALKENADSNIKDDSVTQITINDLQCNLPLNQ